MFNSYEEYMQNVLGLRNQNTYMQGMENYFEQRRASNKYTRDK